MICNKCKESIDVGEACRAEPITTGSNHHHFFHLGCYSQVKEDRQKDQLSLPLQLATERR